MTQKEFEAKLQDEVHKDITVVKNENHPEMAGVYYQGIYTSVACPADNIYEEPKNDYGTKYGRHRTVGEVIALVKARYDDFSSEEYQKSMTEDVE